jgi:glycosyltransferase involved in cell wall biosynthesis
MTGSETATRVAVLAIHPLYDNRVRNHLDTLVQAGMDVTYINWWAPRPGDSDFAHFRSIRLIHRTASPAFGWNMIRYAWLLWWFLGKTLTVRADIVHLHDLLLLPLAPVLRLLGYRRIVFDVHEHYLRWPAHMGLFARLCYAVCLPAVAGLVGVSPSTLPTTRKPSVVIPNYQRQDEFCQPSAPAADSGDTVTAIYFGSLSSDDRDVDLILDVAEYLLSADARVRFKLGGRFSGREGDRFRRRIESLGPRFPGRFHWFGEMPREQVLRESAGADLGLLFVKAGTRNVIGGSPNKVFQYMALGAAIIASNGFLEDAEVLEAGAGILFPIGTDSMTVCASVGALVADARQLADMKRASARLGRKYTWDAVAHRYLDLYATMAAAGRQPREVAG